MLEDKQTNWVLGGNFELGVYPLPEIWLTALYATSMKIEPP